MGQGVGYTKIQVKWSTGWLIARQAIEVGSELCVSYGVEYWWW